MQLQEENKELVQEIRAAKAEAESARIAEAAMRLGMTDHFCEQLDNTVPASRMVPKPCIYTLPMYCYCPSIHRSMSLDLLHMLHSARQGARGRG